MEIAPLQRPGPVLAAQAAPVDTQKAAENREIIQAVKAVNAAELYGSNSELTFLVDRLTQRPVIRLVDKETRDVIRQIPPEYVLRMAEQVNQNSEW
ncbi:MAG TPA: flagellar protein FlaG [Bryobacteraceae bacterium]|nr:flagellar protein FlaG [Bryobacteraceae bacterium]